MNTIMMNKIAKVICEQFNLSVNDLKTPFRDNKFVYPRQVIMHLALKNKLGSTEDIGRFFNRDHATVIHASKCINNYKDTNKLKKEQITNFEHKFSAIKEVNKSLDLFIDEISYLKSELLALEYKFNNANEKMRNYIDYIHNMKL